MSQSVTLQVSGIYTALSDYAGLPPGALNVARNVESRHKNLLEPRRGFDHLPGSAILNVNHKRLTNFTIDGADRIVSLTDADDVVYYDATTDAWITVAGLSTGIAGIDALAKPRFVRGDQNLYLTTQEGVLSLASAASAEMLRAGVPKGLNCEAETTADTSGFFTNNVVTDTTVNTTSGSPNISGLNDTSGIEVGQYVFATNIAAGTTVLSITPEATVIAQTGNTTAGSATISNLASNAGLVAGLLVSGSGIPEGATIASISGAGPYSVVLTSPLVAFQTATGTLITFTSQLVVGLSANASSTLTATPVSFYSGSQVAYRVVFGRVESDADGNQTTRIGAPSAMAVAVNTSGYTTNATVTATLPKNSDESISFVRLFRSEQTASAAITPLDQMQLVFERELVAGDFTARTITITDEAPDSVKGIPLYTGTDREGILQANNPPPAAWDMCIFRNFALYGNITQPSTLSITLTAVGPASGVQIGDVITITSGAVSRTYTAGAAENLVTRTFEIVTSGTDSQNITDTTNSLIRVINYDESLPVHAILTSTTTDLPGQMVLESDIPFGTFTATINAHATAFDPTLTALSSDLNAVANGVSVSKISELEAVPGANLLTVGDSSSPIYRVLALRDYAVVLKGDGIYKIQGNTPTNLSVTPFDLTAKIIGPDTAVSLNSGVWMLSNQGVVSISDAGLNQISSPIDDTINELIGSILDGLNETAFAVGYESDRKYILSVPATDIDESTSTQHVFNYVTSSWSTWDRNLFYAFVHSDEGKLYISRDDGLDNGVSVERKSATFRDYADEDVAVTIASLTDTTHVVLSSVADCEVGDILYQSIGVFSPITAIDVETLEVTLQYEMSWTVGAAMILPSIDTEIEWKQVFGDNPAYTRQFPEGLVLFKNARFNEAIMTFATDFSQSREDVTLSGAALGGWGLSPWGSGNWGGTVAPQGLRFYVPANKQYGSYIIPRILIKQAWSGFKLQGISMSWQGISQEVGK